MRRLDVLRFPSPIGELHFSMRFSNTTKRRTNLFPSPIGELHFSIVYLWKLEMEWKWCFRPLSGSYISQSCFFISLSYSSLVSVPYRGATFLNTEKTKEEIAAKKAFPSPIGELHFSIHIRFGVNFFLTRVSVPYRGATFLNKMA